MAVVVAAVAGVAAWTSYLHTVAVVVEHGEDASTARLIPVTTDGLIVAAGLVLLYSARAGRKPPKLARVMLAAGIAATLATNALHGVAHGPVGALVAAWPAATFVGVSELALWLIRASPTTIAAAAPVAAPVTPAAPAGDRPTATVADHVAAVREWLANDPAMTGAAIAAKLGVSERTGRRVRAAATASR